MIRSKSKSKTKTKKEREKHKLGLALFKSIKHWEDMILWAVRQDAGDPVELNEMLNALNETWFAEYCALCTHFNDDCDLCVMTPVCDADYDYLDDMSPWQRVQHAKTWGKWVCEAGQMLKELLQLHREYVGPLKQIGVRRWKR